MTQSDTKPPRSENQKLLLAMSGIIMSILLAALDQTIVSTAMPRIISELNGFNLLSWVTTAYLLTSTATIPIAGKLGDIFGRKWLLVSAVVIFLAGSFLSGAAPSMEWLIIFRAFQGIGAGALQSNAFAVIGELFPDSAKRARWQGLIAASFGMASVFGPTLGGWITDGPGWRWVFYVNLPVGLIALPTLLLTLPNKAGSGKRKIDWLGAATITGAVITLLLALSWGGQKEPKGYAWGSPQIIGLLVATVILTSLFLFIEQRVAEPILPLRLFSIPAIRSISGLALTLGALLIGTNLFIPLYVQVVQGQSASNSGLVTTPLTLALVFANIGTGQFIGRVGRLKWPMYGGAICALIGTGFLLSLSATTPLWVLTLGMIILGAGLGQILPTMTITVQESVERRDLGVGTSTVQFFRSIGSTIGASLIGTVVTNSYVSSVAGNTITAKLPTQLLNVIEEPQSLLKPEVTRQLPPDVISTVREALVGAIHNGFLITLATCILTLLIVLTIPNIRIKSALRRQKQAAALTPAQDNATDGLSQSGLAEGMVTETTGTGWVEPTNTPVSAGATRTDTRQGKGL